MAGNWGSTDGNDDFTVWSPSTGTWWKRGVGQVSWGGATDNPVPGDYNGDAIMNPGVYRGCEGNRCHVDGPDQSYWYIENYCLAGAQCADYNSNGTIDTRTPWGKVGDIPVPGHYDGNQRTDFAVWRPSVGEWYIRFWNGLARTVGWGVSGDIPVPADYNGDGRTDVAVYRPCEPCSGEYLGYWYLESVALPGEIQGDFNGNGTTDTRVQWGRVNHVPVPGNYYGDAKADLAVWDSGGRPYPVYYVRGQPNLLWGSYYQHGLTGDFDFSWADEAMWHPCGTACTPSSLAYWYVEHAIIPGASAYGDFNGNGTTDSQIQWGRASDIPLAGRHGR